MRQSLLSGFETCGRRTLHGLQFDQVDGYADWAVGYVDYTAELGKALHLFARKYLRVLRASGDANMDWQVARPLVLEVLAEADFILPSDERDELFWLCRGFCHFRWPSRNIRSLERRLSMDVAGPDGVYRTITGQPDVIIADPDTVQPGVVIVDYKSTRARPPSPKNQPDAEYAEGKKYLSDRGHFQLDTYGAMVLVGSPNLFKATLRQLFARSGQIREASLTRDELPYVLEQLGIQAMRLEGAVKEGPTSRLWAPHSGAHCAKQCPVARSCPIPAEMRGDGAVESDEMQDRWGERWVTHHAQDLAIKRALQTREAATGRPAVLPDGKHLRWHEKPDGGRSWGICDKDAPLDPKLVQALEQREAENDLEGLLEASVIAVQATKGTLQ
jgi:hypothetical protein